MSEAAPNRGRLLVATDRTGRVVAAALSGEEDEMRSGIEVLDGQTLHEVDLPSEFAGAHLDAILGALDHATVAPSGSLKLRKTPRGK